jgi:hypothetical protein
VDLIRSACRDYSRCLAIEAHVFARVRGRWRKRVGALLDEVMGRARVGGVKWVTRELVGEVVGRR